MKAKTKELAMKALKRSRDDASDNYYRAKNAFKYHTKEQMQKPYGHSNDTCQQILDGYKDWLDAAEVALADLEKEPTSE